MRCLADFFFRLRESISSSHEMTEFVLPASSRDQAFSFPRIVMSREVCNEGTGKEPTFCAPATIELRKRETWRFSGSKLTKRSDEAVGISWDLIS